MESSPEMDGNDEYAEIVEDPRATTGRDRIPIHPFPMPSSSSPAKKVAPKVNPDDAVTPIPSDFQEKSQLRASINDGLVHESMYGLLEKEGIVMPRATGLFSRSLFRDAGKLAGSRCGVAVPDVNPPPPTRLHHDDGSSPLSRQFHSPLLSRRLQDVPDTQVVCWV